MSVARSLAQQLGGRWSARALDASGFCATWQAQGEQAALFVKSLPAARAAVLEAEADGLEALAATGTVRVPAVIGCWRDGESEQALLALEWLPLASPDAGFGQLYHLLNHAVLFGGGYLRQSLDLARTLGQR